MEKGIKKDEMYVCVSDQKCKYNHICGFSAL